MSEYTENEHGEHQSAEDVAAYLDGTLGDADRERIEAHAAECEECLRELAEVSATVRRMRPTPAWRVWAPAVAAAAAIALLIARPFGMDTVSERTSRLRGSESTAESRGGLTIDVLAPPDNETVAPTAVVFVWHARGVGASYHLTVTDDEGGVVWTLATPDTVARPPDTVVFARDSRHYWYVDGLLEDGRHATSGVHSFTTER